MYGGEPIAAWKEEIEPDARVLVVRGELDMSIADLFGNAAEKFATKEDDVRLAIDLSAVTFMDSCGLRALLGVHDLAPRSLVLRKPSRAVRRLLQLTVPGLVTID